MVIRQGEVYWIYRSARSGPEHVYKHPHVVLQNNAFNDSPINTVVVCQVTSNLKRAGVPGNVLLEQGEGHLPRQSVVNVSQVFTVYKNELGARIGSLSGWRVRRILDGLHLVTEPREPA